MDQKPLLKGVISLLYDVKAYYIQPRLSSSWIIVTNSLWPLVLYGIFRIKLHSNCAVVLFQIDGGELCPVKTDDMVHIANEFGVFTHYRNLFLAFVNRSAILDGLATFETFSDVSVTFNICTPTVLLNGHCRLCWWQHIINIENVYRTVH